MSTLSDGVHVRTTDDGFVEVQSVKHQDGGDIGSTLRFERASGQDLCAHADMVYADEGPETSEVKASGDVVTFHISGTEGAPVLNLSNQRADGESGVALDWRQVPKVFSKVSAILDGDTELP